MTDPTIFDGWEERLAAIPVDTRYCKCGHMAAVHEAMTKMNRHGEMYQEPFRCHYKDCKCKDLRLKKRKNRVKFFFTGRG